MKFYHFPQAAGIDTLTLAEAEIPRPARGEVLVRMHAASLNYRDLMVASGNYGRGAAPANLVPLSDGAGEVVETGAGVTRVKTGDRVAGMFMQSWQGGEISPEDPASSMGGAIDGVLSEYKLFDQHGLVHLPKHLSYEEGSVELGVPRRTPPLAHPRSDSHDPCFHPRSWSWPTRLAARRGCGGSGQPT